MSDDIERRVERLERETGVYKDRLEEELLAWSSNLSLDLVEVTTDAVQDLAHFRVNRCLNATDFKAIDDRFRKYRVYTPEENSRGDWVAFEAEV